MMMRVTSSLTDRTTAYAKAALDGSIVAGPHVRNACQRHLDDVERGAVRGLRYDEKIAERALVELFEKRLKLSEGQFEGKPFKADPSQDFIIGSLFGWQ